MDNPLYMGVNPRLYIYYMYKLYDTDDEFRYSAMNAGDIQLRINKTLSRSNIYSQKCISCTYAGYFIVGIPLNDIAVAYVGYRVLRDIGISSRFTIIKGRIYKSGNILYRPGCIYKQNQTSDDIEYLIDLSNYGWVNNDVSRVC